MRRRDVRVHLYDVLSAADAIASFIHGRSAADYRKDLLLRSAVERQFEVLGEALGRALRTEPLLQERLPAARRAVDFRNVIAHGYDVLSAATVWDIARNELPALAHDVRAELERRGSPTT